MKAATQPTQREIMRDLFAQQPILRARELREAGVDQIDALGRDTYREESNFFSFRRASHRGEPTGGRQISLILLA